VVKPSGGSDGELGGVGSPGGEPGAGASGEAGGPGAEDSGEPWGDANLGSDAVWSSMAMGDIFACCWFLMVRRAHLMKMHYTRKTSI
jgi:hypothetical protein